MRMQMLAKPSLNLLQRTGGDHRGGRAQSGWRTFMMTCLHWIMGYMRLEIWCKSASLGDWRLCTALCMLLLDWKRTRKISNWSENFFDSCDSCCCCLTEKLMPASRTNVIQLIVFAVQVLKWQMVVQHWRRQFLFLLHLSRQVNLRLLQPTLSTYLL